MFINTTALLYRLPFMKNSDKRSAEYKEGYDRAIDDVMKLTKELEEGISLESFKDNCPLWDRMKRGI